jgi:hypothetical protein
MKISIITSQATGIIKALGNIGFRRMDAVIWTRSPVRIKGMWRAEVWV